MGRNQYWAGRVYDLCVYYMTGTPEGSTESGFMEKPGIDPATPGLQGIALIHYTTGASFTITFCGFPGSKPVPPGWFKIRVAFITGTPEGSTESDFMEKPGIEPATPGLQGIALIHYTTGASFTITWCRNVARPAITEFACPSKLSKHYF